MKEFILGDEDIDRTLRDFPRNIQESAIRAAARQGGNIIKKRAKSILESSVTDERNTAKSGQSKLAYIARMIKVVTSRSKTSPGVNVYVKGPDIPVGDREWHVEGYAILLGDGAEGERTTRSTGARRGKFPGFGNFLLKANKEVGGQAQVVFLRNIDKHIGRALQRSIRKHGG